MFDDRVTIIAEIGSNHDGDLGRALASIDAVADCGADIAKFQGFLADDMVDSLSPDYDLLKNLEVPRRWYPKLMERCKSRGIRFLSTATNDTTMDWMESFGAWGYKVASCNITYVPMIERLIKIGKPIIVSTGLADFQDVMDIVEQMRHGGVEKFAILHCVSRYPAQAKDLRLENIRILREKLKCPVGFSDHSESLSFAIAAVALGACIVEKHITLDGKGISPDHSFSLKPDAFRELVLAIRETETALFSDFSYDPDIAFSMRRSLHFARDMKSGEAVQAKDLKFTRPEDGLRPNCLHDVVGQTLVHDAKAGSPVTDDMINRTGVASE